ncbi:MAG: hypothetical protein AAB344_04400 [Bacteroidota bacterium]
MFDDVEIGKEKSMWRIVSFVTVQNVIDPSKRIQFDAFVDTGASLMVLPSVWKERLGSFFMSRKVSLEMATQERTEGEVCGPVQLRLEGFDPINTNVVFSDMKPVDGDYEPLIGYIVLEQSMAAVDMVGHRLINTRKLDLK